MFAKIALTIFLTLFAGPISGNFYFAQSARADDLDRRGFIAELEGFKAEIQKSRARFAGQWAYENINATYIEYFQKAGSLEPTRYAQAWPQNGQWLKYVADGTIYTTVLTRPIVDLDASIDNLTRLDKPFTRNDMIYFRKQMELWRARANELERNMAEYARIVATRQADLVRYQKTAKPTPEMKLGFDAREKERSARLSALASSLNRDLRMPVFGYVIGEPRAMAKR